MADKNAATKALEHFSRSDNGLDLYKCFGVIEADLRDRVVIWPRGWATLAEITDLAATANYYLDPRVRRTPRLLSHEQARELIRRVLREWLKEKKWRGRKP